MLDSLIVTHLQVDNALKCNSGLFIWFSFQRFFLSQAFVGSGISLPLTFTSNSWSERADDRLPTQEFVDFEKDLGKV
jgi:hypothetical protein